MSGVPGPALVRRLGMSGLLVVVAIVMLLVDSPSVERRPVGVPDVVDVAQVGAADYRTPPQALRNRSMPVSGPIGVASTTWFCGGAPARATTLVLTNRASRPRSVVVTTITSKQASAVRHLSVPAATTTSVTLGSGDVGTIGAVVESRHGGVVATQRVTGGGSVTTAACATTSSSSWFFAGGDTQRGSTETLALFNPFDDLATADVAFLTADGFRLPQATQGLAVPGHSVVLVDVASVQNRRSDLGAVVTTRSGRLVSWRFQTFDGSGPASGDGEPPKGVSLALGSPVPVTRFVLPTAVNGQGVAPRIILANPGASSSTVRLTFAVDDPATNGQPPPTTIDLVSGAVVVLGPDQLRQVASGVPFSVTGSVVDGGAVVAELWVDGAAPARGHGAFATPAFGLAATEWVLPIGIELPVLDQLGVQAADGRARLRLWVVVNGKRRRIVPTGQPTAVAAHGRITIDLAKALADHPGASVLVEASAPVTVSRLQTGADERGLVSTPGIPVAGGLSTP